jgi:hypothetical protein
MLPSIRLFPDLCNIRPIRSAGHGPGAENKSVPDTAVLDVPCSVQDKLDKDLAGQASQGRQTVTEVYFRDEDATREALRDIPTNSVIEVIGRDGVTLATPKKVMVDRAVLTNLPGLAIWRVDSMTRI